MTTWFERKIRGQVNGLDEVKSHCVSWRNGPSTGPSAALQSLANHRAVCALTTNQRGATLQTKPWCYCESPAQRLRWRWTHGHRDFEPSQKNIHTGRLSGGTQCQCKRAECWRWWNRRDNWQEFTGLEAFSQQSACLSRAGAKPGQVQGDNSFLSLVTSA